IWFGKDVKYDHLRVFGCKAFVHVPKDERSKLDMKTRMYDPVEKKLVKSRDVQFMEDQTIIDIDKNDGLDVPLDNDIEEEQEMSQDENLGDALEPPLVQLRRSNRQRQSSTRYTSDEYVTLTDGEEPKCYQESMKSEERQKTWQSKLEKCVALSTTKAELVRVQLILVKNSTFHSRSKHIDAWYHWIRNALDAKLLELTKVHTDNNGADMMTKTVPRGKFEAYCEIARLMITST
ncbi:hypothetical protein CR513_01100, partial [Mucuna pruriens]